MIDMMVHRLNERRKMAVRAAGQGGGGGDGAGILWGGGFGKVPSSIPPPARQSGPHQNFDRERIMKLSNEYSATCHHW
jgi:hypothetical protein